MGYSNATLNTIYTVQYKVTNPCIDSSEINIKALDCDSLAPILFAPNSFNPDKYGFNDQFLPVGRNLENYKLYVFNRWGELLFETNQLTQGWDGTNKGEKSPIDTYVWRITYKEISSTEVHSKIVHVNIIR